jgi:hypothetical protein
MERKALNIAGINRNSEVTRGENISCLEIINMRMKDNAWRESKPKVLKKTHARVYDEEFIHTMDTIKNWIGWSLTEGKVYLSGTTETEIGTLSATSVKFESVGNVLVIYANTSTGVKTLYSLFDRSSLTYAAFVDFDFEVMDLRFFVQRQKYRWKFSHLVTVSGSTQANMIGVNVIDKGANLFDINLHYYTSTTEQIISFQTDVTVPVRWKFFQLAAYPNRVYFVNTVFEPSHPNIFVYYIEYNSGTNSYGAVVLSSIPSGKASEVETEAYATVLDGNCLWDEEEGLFILNNTQGGESSKIDVSAGSTLEEKYTIVEGVYLKDKSFANSRGYMEGFVFVTFALKMFDGSYIKYSFPQLIYVGEETVNLSTFGKIIANEVDVSGFEFQTIGMYIPSAEATKITDLLTKYDKLITHLDIFISNPVPRFDFSNHTTYVQQGGYIKTLNEFSAFYKVQSIAIADLSKYVYAGEPINAGTFLNGRILHYIPNTTGIYGNFNFILSYSEFLNQFVDLRTLTALEAMPVDNYTSHINYSNTLFKYNNRLMAANITQKLFKGFSPKWFLKAAPTSSGNLVQFEVELDTANGKKYVRSETYLTTEDVFYMPESFGYPDNRATYFRIIGAASGYSELRVLREVKLTKHLTHNYSYYIAPDLFQLYINELVANNIYTLNRTVAFDFVVYLTAPAAPTRLNTDIIYDTNLIKITETNNPFVFPAKYTYQVGNSEIVGLNSNAEPVSSGQFGQYPIIVFTKTGIWTLNIAESDQIYISNITPLNGEVCTNPDSITNILGAILYVSDENIKMQRGAQILIISDMLKGLYQSKAFSETFYGQMTNSTGIFNLPDSLSEVSFQTYLAWAKFGQNRLNDEFIVTNPTYNYSYIFNAKYKIWYKISGSYDKIVQDYPECYGVIGDDVYSLSEESGNPKIFLETQGIEFSPDGFSKIKRFKIDILISLQGKFGAYLLGSMDGQKWGVINGMEMLTDFTFFEMQMTHLSVKYIKLIISSEVKTIEMKNILTEVELGFREKIR